MINAPTWLYHANIAPKGKLYEKLTAELLQNLTTEGWVDSPAKFGSEVKQAVVNTQKSKPIVSLDVLSDDKLVGVIDDMGRSDVEMHLTIRGVSHNDEQQTNMLRSVLLENVRPGLNKPKAVVEGDDDETEPPSKANATATATSDQLLEMPDDERAASIAAMSVDHVRGVLKSLDIKVSSRTGEVKLRAALAAFYQE